MRKSSLLIADNLNNEFKITPPKQRDTSHRFDRRMRSDSLFGTVSDSCDDNKLQNLIKDDPIDSIVSESIHD